MKKLAVFVEGRTEALFIEALLRAIAGENNVLIEKRRVTGGTHSRRRMSLVEGARPATGQKYFVLIIDCGGHHQVKGRILEEHENLTRSGYDRIIALRDVRPDFAHADIPRLETTLPRYIKTSLIPVDFILAVMELEAWFLAETSHFARIDPSLSLPSIVNTLGFDPQTEDMQLRECPAEDLDRCYALVGKSYQKGEQELTVAALDYAVVYCELRQKFSHLDRLIVSIGQFLS